MYLLSVAHFKAVSVVADLLLAPLLQLEQMNAT
jgi:hypothetical protein